ncbi:hypothetical protein J6590_048642 [Homalodisca vitripennis]|nr:hypothetical protein J6590_048642 [Homalodisca vitripennis]
MVTHVWENTSKVEQLGLRADGCFYSGKVQGDPQSSVAVSLCHGMKPNEDRRSRHDLSSFLKATTNGWPPLRLNRLPGDLTSIDHPGQELLGPAAISASYPLSATVDIRRKMKDARLCRDYRKQQAS